MKLSFHYHCTAPGIHAWTTLHVALIRTNDVRVFFLFLFLFSNFIFKDYMNECGNKFQIKLLSTGEVTPWNLLGQQSANLDILKIAS